MCALSGFLMIPKEQQTFFSGEFFLLISTLEIWYLAGS